LVHTNLLTDQFYFCIADFDPRNNRDFVEFIICVVVYTCDK